MPVFSAALAGLTTWMTGMLTTAGLSAAAAGVVSNFVVGTTATVLSNMLLSKKQTAPRMDYKTTVTQSVAPRRRGYGRMKAAGIRAFLRQKDDQVHQVVMFNHGKIHSFERIYHGDIALNLDSLGRATNDILVTDSGRHYVRVETRLGSDESLAYSELITNFPTHWSEAHRLNGIATARVMFKAPNAEDYSNAFPRGVETPTQAIMELSEVYDPRDGAVKYSQNSGLAILDYLSHPDGYRLPLSRINLQSFAAFAGLCDQPTTRPSSRVEPRYWLGGFYELTDNPVSVLQRMMSTCDAEFSIDAEGRVGIQGGRWDEPTVTITDRDIIEFSLSEGNDKFAAFNQLKITYTAPGQDYEPAEAPAWVDAADQGRRGVLEDPFDVDMVQSAVQAQRLAAIYAAKMNPKWQGTIKTTLYGLLARGERTIRLQIDELGINDTFWIESHGISSDLTGCEISLRSLGPEAYAYKPATEGTPDLPGDDDVVRDTAPAGVEIKVETRAGTKVIVASATERGEADTLDGQYRVDPSGAWQQMTGVAGTAQTESGPVSTGTVYGVRVRWISPNGAAGNWSAYQTVTVTSGGIDPGGTDVVIDPGDWTGATHEQIRAALMEGIASGIPVALNRTFTLTAPVSPIEMTSGSLLVQGNGRLHATADMPAGVVQITCNHFAPVAVTGISQTSYTFPGADAASVVTIITAAGHGAEVGDWVKIVADDPIPGANGVQRRIGEFRYVVRVDGANIYTSGPLTETYTLNIRLARVNRAASLVWNGPRFSSVPGNTWKTVFLNVRGFLWPKIRTSCEDGYSIGVNLQSCVQPDVEADVRRMLNRVDSLGISGYGIQNSCCHHGRFSGNFQDCRHFYTSNSLSSVPGDQPWRYGRSHGALVTGHGSDTTSAGFDTHSEGTGHVYADIVTGSGRFGEAASGASWQFRGRDNRLNGGTDTGSQHGGQFYSQQAGDCIRCEARDFDYTGTGDWIRVTSGATGYVKQARVIGGVGQTSNARSIYVKDGEVTLEDITLRPTGATSGTTGVMLNGNAKVRLVNPTVDLADYGSTGYRLAAFGSGSVGNEIDIEGVITILNPGAKMSGIFSGASTSGKVRITGRINAPIAIPGIVSGTALTEAYVAREGGYFSGSGDWYRFDGEGGRVLGGTARFSGSRAIYAQNAKVVLDELHLIPTGSAGGTTGVMLDGGATVHVRDMLVDLAEFTGTSYRVAGFSTGSTGNTLVVERCTVINAGSSAKFQAFVSAANTSGSVTVMDYRSDAAPVSVIVNGGSLTASQVYNDPENFKALVTQLKSTSAVPSGWTAPFA